MDPYKKGQSRERMVRDLLEVHGWKIAFKSQRMRFGMVDLGIILKDKEQQKTQARFDIWAIKNKKWKFISVKSESSYRPTELDRINKFILDFCPTDPFMDERIQFEVWVFCPQKWRGRGKDKYFVKSHWKKYTLFGFPPPPMMEELKG